VAAERRRLDMEDRQQAFQRARTSRQCSTDLRVEQHRRHDCQRNVYVRRSLKIGAVKRLFSLSALIAAIDFV